MPVECLLYFFFCLSYNQEGEPQLELPFLIICTNKMRMDYLTYSAKSVRRMSPLRRKVSCIAKAALRQW